jgi:hypothetical protein
MKIYLKNFVLSQVTVIFALACFALVPQARAVCQEGCLTSNNTVLGDNALISNTSGSTNTAIGDSALFSNTTAFDNTAIGVDALNANTTGNQNTATGVFALDFNTTGFANTASGVSALGNNTTGFNNAAIGYNALQLNTTGNSNTALGYQAGKNQTSGSNNVYIGANINGLAGESNACRIKSIFGQAAANGVAVLITSGNKLGTAPSSARFKEAIKPMDKASEAILGLKPVTFRYKHDLDPNGIPQFGLVAEEVEKVNPDLVARDEQGKPYTVRYDAVNAMLLNEFLKEHRTVQEQGTTITEQQKDFEAAIAQQQKQIEALTATVKEQAAQIQKVSAQFKLNKPAPQTVLNNE